MRRARASSPDPVRIAFAAVGVGLVVVAGFSWSSTRLGEYSVMTTGHVVDGHGGAARPPGSSHHGGVGSAAAATGSSRSVGGVDVTSLVADPARPVDVRVQLTARRGQVSVPGGRALEGYTVNGTSPGPTVRARQGDLVEVTFVNESVADGATLHWHGIDVPNAADGVAGVTQDAVPVGGRFVYRFVAKDAGTYWYHSHQMSHEQVERGLFGAVVILPRDGTGRGGPAGGAEAAAVDEVALLHVYGGQHTLNGAAQDARVSAAPGKRVRVRVVNTDQGTAAVWASVPYRVAATDGHEVSGPTDVVGQRVLVAAGGRVDLMLEVPDSGAARIRLGGARSLVVGPEGAAAPEVPQPRSTLDLLTYGRSAPLAFDAERPDRVFDYVIGRRIGLIDGRPGSFWTINGHMYPDVPMFHVAEGDVVRFRVVNDSGEVHPMHLHGHHVVVRSRDHVVAQGSPWVVDSLDVYPGESYELAFVADNPGIWSDHCHTLAHAVDGLIAHLMYEGVTTPFTIGGAHGNHPE
jgi:FtsP/CotA-like multicopper oxidase with cupredoxin domain